MNTIHLKSNISAEQFEMVIRVLKALNVLDNTTTSDPYTITKEDLLAFSRSEEDIKAGGVKDNKIVHQRARNLCGE